MVLSRFVVVLSRFGRGAVQVRSWCARGAVEVCSTVSI